MENNFVPAMWIMLLSLFILWGTRNLPRPQPNPDLTAAQDLIRQIEKEANNGKLEWGKIIINRSYPR